MKSNLLRQNIEHINLQESIKALEQGNILFFPEHSFVAIDPTLMSESILDGSHKNVSYDYKRQKLGAFKNHVIELEPKLKKMMNAYAEFPFAMGKNQF